MVTGGGSEIRCSLFGDRPAMGCGRFVKVLLDQELIITSGGEVTVQYSLACEQAGCSACFFPVSGRPACRQGRGR